MPPHSVGSSPFTLERRQNRGRAQRWNGNQAARHAQRPAPCPRLDKEIRLAEAEGLLPRHGPAVAAVVRRDGSDKGLRPSKWNVNTKLVGAFTESQQALVINTDLQPIHKSSAASPVHMPRGSSFRLRGQVDAYGHHVGASLEVGSDNSYVNNQPAQSARRGPRATVG
jgi:hypothetical protein